MKSMIRFLALVLALIAAPVARAQVQWSGPTTPGHIPCSVTSNVLQDCGTVAAPQANALGFYNGANQPLSISSQTLPGAPTGQYATLTLGVSNSAANITVTGFGGLSTPPLNINVGSTTYTFPATGAFGLTASSLTLLGSTSGSTVLLAQPVASGTLRLPAATGTLSLAPTNAVWMIGTTPNNVTTWTVYKPDGSILSTTGTTTSGLQEAINYAVANAYPLRVVGFAQEAVTQPAITATSGITIPPTSQADIRLYSVNITCSAALGATDCLTFNSLENSVFEMSGQIVYLGTGHAVMIKPTTPTPVDALTIVSENRFKFDAIVANSTAASALVIDTTSGSFSRNELKVAEVNAASAPYGVLIQNPQASTAAFQNYFLLSYVHSFATAGVQIGLNTTNQTANRQNTWIVQSASSTANPNHAFVTFGNGDFIRLSVNDSSNSDGLTFQSGAVNNNYVVTTVNVSSPVIDSGGNASGNAGYVNGQSSGGTQFTLQGATSGSTVLIPTGVASGTLTLPAATDTLIGKATTDVLTNKTFDTAGAGNVFKINGTQISAVTGTGSAVLATSPTIATINGITLLNTSSASAMNLAVNSNNIVNIADGGGSHFGINISAGNNGAISSAGGSLLLYANATNSVTIGTNSGSANQVVITHTATPTNTLNLTGSNGGAPSITTSGGGISIGSGAGTTTLSDANLTITAAAPVITNLATDSTHTDRTVCQDTTSKALLFGSGAAGICLGTSSARFKTNIHVADYGLSQIMALKPISYFYKPGYGNNGDHVLYGFTAEDVAPVMPKLVGLDAGGRPNSVDMTGMIPIIVAAVQTQQREIEQLRGRAANDDAPPDSLLGRLRRAVGF